MLNICEDQKEKSRGYLERLEGEIAKKNELVSQQRAFFDDVLARRQHFISAIMDTEKVKHIFRIY